MHAGLRTEESDIVCQLFALINGSIMSLIVPSNGSP